MRKIIKNAVYDTNTARLLTSAVERNNPFLEENTEVFLYRKKTGEYFYHQVAENGSERIIPTNRQKAKKWLLTHFSEEDAENVLSPLKTFKDKIFKVVVPFPAEVKSDLTVCAEELGIPQNEFIISCVKMGIKAQRNGLRLAKITDKDFENIKVFVDDRPDNPFD